MFSKLASLSTDSMQINLMLSLFQNGRSVARFGENSPFGGKMTFLWEFFSDPYVVNGEFLAKSLFSTWGILKFLI
jgi:hypothetical protein